MKIFISMIFMLLASLSVTSQVILDKTKPVGSRENPQMVSSVEDIPVSPHSRRVSNGFSYSCSWAGAPSPGAYPQWNCTCYESFTVISDVYNIPYYWYGVASSCSKCNESNLPPSGACTGGPAAFQTITKDTIVVEKSKSYLNSDEKIKNNYEKIFKNSFIVNPQIKMGILSNRVPHKLFKLMTDYNWVGCTQINGPGGDCFVECNGCIKETWEPIPTYPFYTNYTAVPTTLNSCTLNGPMYASNGCRIYAASNPAIAKK